MKKIIINEHQEKIVVNEAMKQGFSIDMLYSLPSFSKKIQYCTQMLGKPIGRGSSRAVFQIDDETVLKLAINPKGIAQNEQEGQQDWYRDDLGVTPKVYHDYNKEGDYTFIVSEYVLPAKKEDFKVCLGVDFETFQMFMTTAYNQYARRKNWLAELDYDEFNELLETNDDLYQFYDYMTNYQVPLGDVIRLANLGMVQRNGQPYIVILDSGLTDDIFNRYYKK